MVQMNKSLTSIPQRLFDMNSLCVPIENCDYMPLITDLHQQNSFFM